MRKGSSGAGGDIVYRPRPALDAGKLDPLVHAASSDRIKTSMKSGTIQVVKVK